MHRYNRISVMWATQQIHLYHFTPSFPVLIIELLEIFCPITGHAGTRKAPCLALASAVPTDTSTKFQVRLHAMSWASPNKKIGHRYTKIEVNFWNSIGIKFLLYCFNLTHALRRRSAAPLRFVRRRNT